MATSKGARDSAGKNLSVWFKDAEVAAQLDALAAKLKTSSSAILFELTSKCLPTLVANSHQREIRLDGVRVEI